MPRRSRQVPGRVRLLVMGGLVLATLLVYGQVVDFEFVRTDDRTYVADNPRVLGGPTWANVYWAFTTFEASNWHPLTWLSLMLDAQIDGSDPRQYHLTNLLLHVANALLLFHVLRRMTGSEGRSAFVAFVFAVHPLHVESVAWVAERKDVLSTLFWLLAMLAWVRYAERPAGSRYALVAAALALGLMAKPMLVTLPLVLLLVDYWPLGRLEADGFWNRRAVWEKIPLLALSAASCAVTLRAQAGAMGGFEVYPLGLRITNAAVSYLRYIAKTLWPFDLTLFYRYDANPSPWYVGVAAVVLVGVTALSLKLRRTRPYLAVGWFWYLVTLIPVIGLVQVGAQPMADRYTYVPQIGLTILLAWTAGDLLGRGARDRKVLAATAILAVMALIPAARTQVRHWRDSVRLFTHAIDVDGHNVMARHWLGVEWFERGDTDRAIRSYREALKIDPGAVHSRVNLAAALLQQGRIDEAVEEYREALRAGPDPHDTLTDLGVALTRQGQLDEAAEHLSEALRIAPDDPRAHKALAVALGRSGKLDEAAAHLERALRATPEDTDARFNLAIILDRQGRLERAAEELRELLRIAPENVNARRSLGRALARQGRWNEAIDEYSEAVRRAPDREDLRSELDVLRKAASGAAE